METTYKQSNARNCTGYVRNRGTHCLQTGWLIQAKVQSRLAELYERGHDHQGRGTRDLADIEVLFVEDCCGREKARKLK